MEKEIIEQVYYKLFDPEESLEALMKQWPSYKKNGLGYVEELHSKLSFAMVQYQNSDKDPDQIGSCFPVHELFLPNRSAVQKRLPADMRFFSSSLRF